MTDTSTKNTAAPTVTAVGNIMDHLKYVYSSILLLFSVTVVMYAIFSKQTVTSLNMFVAALLFWICIVWLAIMEGGQGALVGLQSVEASLYAKSHPTTHKNTNVIYRTSAGNRLEQFIVGRQFLVVLVVFILNTLSSSEPGATLFSDSSSPFLKIINTIFLGNGVAVILVTITIGQLISQIESSKCMLDFMNNYFVYFTIYMSLFIECTGLLHAVYLFQMLFSVGKNKSDKKSGHSDDNNIAVDQSEDLKASSTSPTPEKSQASVLFFWLRILISVAILGISFAVTITALVRSETKMWDGVPIPVSIIFFFILMMVVGMLEGLQIALFAVMRRTDLEQDHHMAHKICQLVFSDPKNLPAFLVGRQILVTCCMFIVARITAVNVDLETGTNIFGVSDNLQNFFNTGLLGAVITTIIASLIWRIIASSYPVAFLSNPAPYVLIRICLFLEKSGICSSAWILAYGHKKVMNYHEDVVYIGDQADTDDDEAVADLVLADLALADDAVADETL